MKLTAPFAALVLAAALAGCATSTAYQPRTGSAGQGFADTRLEDNRFRVSFSGNSITPRDTVETYLLYRAAELTLAQGFETFVIADRHTDTKTSTLVTPDPWPGPYGGWRLDWSYYYGFGQDPFWREPRFGPGRHLETNTTEKFKAEAEILLLKGPKDLNDPKAFDARSIMANLGPKVVRPKP